MYLGMIRYSYMPPEWILHHGEAKECTQLAFAWNQVAGQGTAQQAELATLKADKGLFDTNALWMAMPFTMFLQVIGTQETNSEHQELRKKGITLGDHRSLEQRCSKKALVCA